MGPGGAGGPGEAFRDADSFLARAGLRSPTFSGAIFVAVGRGSRAHAAAAAQPAPPASVRGPRTAQVFRSRGNYTRHRLPPVLNTALTPTPLFAPFRQRTPLLTGSREKRDLESFPLSGGCRKTGDAFKIIWKTLNCSFPQIFNEHM